MSYNHRRKKDLVPDREERQISKIPFIGLLVLAVVWGIENVSYILFGNYLLLSIGTQVLLLFFPTGNIAALITAASAWLLVTFFIILILYKVQDFKFSKGVMWVFVLLGGGVSLFIFWQWVSFPLLNFIAASIPV